ncbi:hypothetical protein E4U43_004429, partial [Claviceps pusilla]
MHRKAYPHIHQPPQFYDSLPKVLLTRQALLEVDRRNRQKPSLGPVVSQIRTASVTNSTGKGSDALARIASSGGPDLRHLRGSQYWETLTYTMASLPTSSSAGRPSESTEPTTVGTKKRTKKSSAYDGNFQRLCIENNIYPPLYVFSDKTQSPAPKNFNAILEALEGYRESVTSSIISEKAFDQFRLDSTTRSERTLTWSVIPLIVGSGGIRSLGSLPFNNLASLTNERTVNPAPDFFDGAQFNSLDDEVREALDKIVVPIAPNNDENTLLIAPNLFLELKSVSGDLRTAEAQVMLDGAHGAVIMNSLQNYLLDEPMYDDNAYTFSAIFREG